MCSLIARQAVVPCVANRIRSLCRLTHCPLLLPYVSLDKTLLLPKFRREDRLAAHPAERSLRYCQRRSATVPTFYGIKRLPGPQPS